MGCVLYFVFVELLLCWVLCLNLHHFTLLPSCTEPCLLLWALTHINITDCVAIDVNCHSIFLLFLLPRMLGSVNLIYYFFVWFWVLLMSYSEGRLFCLMFCQRFHPKDRLLDIFHPIFLPLCTGNNLTTVEKRIPIPTLLHFAKSKNWFPIQTKKSTDRKKASECETTPTI